MKRYPSLLVTAAVLVSGLFAAPAASAQLASKPQLGAQVASTTSRAAGATSSGNKWICAAQQSVEIAPVSADVETSGTAYVLIHKRNGEPVSAERITAEDAASLRKLGCESKILEGGVFIGG